MLEEAKRLERVQQSSLAGQQKHLEFFDFSRIGAGGNGSSCTTSGRSKARSAYARARPLRSSSKHPSSYKLVRWVAGETSVLARFARSVEDDQGRPVMLFRNSWDLDFAREQYEGLEFLPQPQDMTVIKEG